MTGEHEEGRADAGAIADAAGAAATGAADEVTATAAGTVTTATDVTTGMTDATAMTTTARDATPTPPPQEEEGARVNASLEAIKTAIVWLVVIQLLTILSPLLPVSLKWAIIVGALLTAGSFAIGGVAYQKARIAQRSLPE